MQITLQLTEHAAVVELVCWRLVGVAAASCGRLDVSGEVGLTTSAVATCDEKQFSHIRTYDGLCMLRYSLPNTQQ
jgi:hypothetical protein